MNGVGVGQALKRMPIGGKIKAYFIDLQLYNP